MLSNYIRDILTVEIEPDQIVVRSLSTNTEVKDSPSIAVNKKLQVIAIGSQAELLKEQSPSGSLALIKPFAHPRVAVNDVELASQLLRRLIERFYGRTYLLPRLTMVIYPPAKLREDLTSLESFAFGEMGWKAGAREVWTIPTDFKLTVQDVKALRKSGLDRFSPLFHEENGRAQK
jgi:actin-like ATPase involved in cell morphogenesis